MTDSPVFLYDLLKFYETVAEKSKMRHKIRYCSWKLVVFSFFLILISRTKATDENRQSAESSTVSRLDIVLIVCLSVLVGANVLGALFIIKRSLLTIASSPASFHKVSSRTILQLGNNAEGRRYECEEMRMITEGRRNGSEDILNISEETHFTHEHDATVVYLLDELFKAYKFILKKNDTQFVKIWKSYQTESNNRPCLVVEHRTDVVKPELPFHQEILVFYNMDTTAQEGLDTNCIDRALFEENEPTINSSVLLDIENKLQNDHSNFVSVNTSTVKSERFFSEEKVITIMDKPVIVIYCRIKGYVPFNEKPFPTYFKGFKTDVRPGFISTAHKRINIGNAIKSTCARHIQTLGPFFKLADKVYALSTSHGFLFDEKIKQQLDGSIKNHDVEHTFEESAEAFVYLMTVHSTNCQEEDKFTMEHSIGDIHKIVFKPSTIGVDVAKIQIEKGQSIEGHFFQQQPNLQYQHDNPSNLGIWEYKDGGFLEVVENLHLNTYMFKSGWKTGFTRGTLTSCNQKITIDAEEEIEKFELSSQLIITPQATRVRTEGKKIQQYQKGIPFSVKGESGAPVFIEEEGKAVLVGLIVAVHSNGDSYATPIKRILDALKIGDLKSFSHLPYAYKCSS